MSQPLSVTPTAATRMSISLSADAAANLDNLAMQAGSAKGEIIRRALALYAVAREGAEKRQRLAILDGDNHIVKEIVGI